MRGPRKTKLVVISVDGLCSGDEGNLRSLPHFRSVIEHGVWVDRMEGIYPSQTYPVHASLVTGCYPDRHGIVSNTLTQPGRARPDWNWYSRYKKVSSLYEKASEVGLAVAIIFWPTAAGAKVKWHLPEIKPTRFWHSLPLLILKNGTPGYILGLGLRFGVKLFGMNTAGLDGFTTASACCTIRKKCPDLLMIHLMDLDNQRHRYGAESPEAFAALERMDQRLASVLEATRDSGASDPTNLVIVGDHGHKNVHHRINLNAAFQAAGLGGKGEKKTGLHRLRPGAFRSRWGAWANACEGSAQIYLSPREDPALKREVKDILQEISFRGEPAIKAIFQGEQIRRLHLSDDIDLVAEANSGYTFTHMPSGEALREAGSRFRSVHGYLPDAEGYRPVFLGSGSSLKEGYRHPSARVIDIGPTLAILLGAELPDADGRVLHELFSHGTVGGHGLTKGRVGDKESHSC